MNLPLRLRDFVSLCFVGNRWFRNYFDFGCRLSFVVVSLLGCTHVFPGLSGVEAEAVISATSGGYADGKNSIVHVFLEDSHACYFPQRGIAYVESMRQGQFSFSQPRYER